MAQSNETLEQRLDDHERHCNERHRKLDEWRGSVDRKLLAIMLIGAVLFGEVILKLLGVV